MIALGSGLTSWWTRGIAGLAMAALVPLLLPEIGSCQEKGKKVYDLGRELPEVKIYGPQAEKPVQREAEGLRFKLAPDRKDLAPVGVEIPVGIAGGFDISTGFEIFKVEEPISEFGAGVVMRVYFDAPDVRDALLSRTRRSGGGDKATAFIIKKKPDGKDDYKWQKEMNPVSPRGRLRISRSGGGAVQFWVKDGDGDYVPLTTVGVGTDPVKSVKVYVTSNHKRTDMDVRLTDVSIEAVQGPPPVAAVAPVAPAVVAAEKDPGTNPPATSPGGRMRLIATAGGVLGLVLVALGIYWIRRSRV